MKILMYYSDWAANVDRQTQDTYGGVGYYRIKKVSEQIKDHQVDIIGAKLTRKDESPSDRWERIFTEYDVFWSCYTSHAEDAAAMFYWRDKLGKKVVLDLDDNFWDVPESNLLYDKLKPTKKDRAFISTILSFADVITCSTEPLAQRIDEHMKGVFGLEKKIVVIPNFNDINDWKQRVSRKTKEKIVIGYAGSNSHQDDLAMFTESLRLIMEKYPNVYFKTIGAIDVKRLSIFDKFSKSALDRCDIVNPSSTFLGYPARMAKMDWDICVAPLVDSAFTRCKSHIKWMEYASHRRPVIASRVYPYFMDLKGCKTIEDGVTGLLVKPSGWYDALEDLILHPEKRKKLGENAYKHVVKEWQYKDSGINEIVNEMLG